MVRVVVIGLFLALAAAGCGGGNGRSEAKKIRSVDEDLSTLPDAGPGLGEASPPPELRAGWRTDFSKRSVSFDEFMSGGPAGTAFRRSTIRGSSPSRRPTSSRTASR